MLFALLCVAAQDGYSSGLKLGPASISSFLLARQQVTVLFSSCGLLPFRQVTSTILGYLYPSKMKTFFVGGNFSSPISAIVIAPFPGRVILASCASLKTHRVCVFSLVASLWQGRDQFRMERSISAGLTFPETAQPLSPMAAMKMNTDCLMRCLLVGFSARTIGYYYCFNMRLRCSVPHILNIVKIISKTSVV